MNDETQGTANQPTAQPARDVIVPQASQYREEVCDGPYTSTRLEGSGTCTMQLANAGNGSYTSAALTQQFVLTSTPNVIPSWREVLAL